MKKFFKVLLLVIVVLLVLIQFVPHPPKNITAGNSVNDIHQKYTVPADVERILKSSCYDCHSNNTEYPWYAKIQPVAWWLGDHIKDGKKHFNFSEFLSYSLRKQYHKLEEINEQLEDDEMPLPSYTFIHREADLSETEKSLLINWANGVRNTMSNTYPIDSLVKKK
jgi:hypothetical protein